MGESDFKAGRGMLTCPQGFSHGLKIAAASKCLERGCKPRPASALVHFNV